MPQRRAWGTGSLYQQPGSRFWWGKVRVQGKQHRFSLKTTEKREALRRLALRVQGLNAGEPTPVRVQLVLGDLERLVETDHHLRHRKPGTLERFNTAFKQLTAGLPAEVAQITNARVRQYAAARLRTASPSTVAVEIAALRRGLRLAVQQGLLDRAPDLTQVGGQRVRQGFVDSATMERVAAGLKEPLKSLMLAAVYTGWRVQSELMTLTWAQVDMQAGVMRLEPGQSKTGEGREFPMGMLPELRRLMERRRAATHGPYVWHRQGRRVKDYEKSWKRACVAAGVPDLRVHDLRRSAVRNLEQAGVPRSVAMKLTGHKSEAVYRRYAIVDQRDLERGADLLAAYHLDQTMQQLR